MTGRGLPLGDDVDETPRDAEDNEPVGRGDLAADRERTGADDAA